VILASRTAGRRKVSVVVGALVGLEPVALPSIDPARLGSSPVLLRPMPRDGGIDKRTPHLASGHSPSKAEASVIALEPRSCSVERKTDLHLNLVSQAARLWQIWCSMKVKPVYAKAAGALRREFFLAK